MSESLQRSLLAKRGLDLLPKSLRQKLLEDDAFLTEFGLSADASLSFGGAATFQTSALFAAIRGAERNPNAPSLADNSGKEWSVKLDLEEGGTVFLSCDAAQLAYSEAPYLLSDTAVRLAALDVAKRKFALPRVVVDRWEGLIRDRPLLDHEAGQLHEDLDHNPVRFSDTLRQAIEKGESSVELLVPKVASYYDRLVGELGKSASVQQHAVEGLSRRVQELIEWNERDGLLYSLLLASHSDLTAAIPLKAVSNETFIEVFAFVRKFGDPLSQLGAVEIGLRALPRCPELESDLVLFIEDIRNDNPDAETSRFRVLGDLFILVDAQLGKDHILGRVPPFYRRLCAMAQASLIQRQIRMQGADPISLCNWSRGNCSGQFYLQSLADLRQEPRWYPDFLQPSQLRSEFCGRLMLAGQNNEEHLPVRVAELLLPNSESPESLRATNEKARPFFPGPLEGAISFERKLPDEVRAAIEEQVGSAEASVDSFIALVNSANLFTLSEDIVESAAESLRNGRYHLRNIGDHDELMVVLVGLARVAAGSRSTSLAKEVRVIVRRYRYDPQFKLSSGDALQILLFAAGAFSELVEWADFVSDCLRELAFADLSNEQANVLHAQLLTLCEAVPELWVAVGRADAALAAFQGVADITERPV